MNGWNDLTFKRKGRNIYYFTSTYHHRPRFRGSDRHPSPDQSKRTA